MATKKFTAVYASADNIISCGNCGCGRWCMHIGVNYEFHTDTEEVFEPQQISEENNIVCMGCGLPVTHASWKDFTNNPTFQKMMVLNGYKGGTNPEHHWSDQPPKLEK